MSCIRHEGNKLVKVHFSIFVLIVALNPLLKFGHLYREAHVPQKVV